MYVIPVLAQYGVEEAGCTRQDENRFSSMGRLHFFCRELESKMMLSYIKFQLMKRFLLVSVVLSLAATAYAQRSIDGIQFMVSRQKAMEEFTRRFGQPVSETCGKAVFSNVVFNGERFSEANVFFDDSDRLQLVRLKDICASHAEAVERMGVLWKKYGQTYSTTEGMNHEDGRFVVGYDKDGMLLFTIATFRNCCDLSFGPF